MVLKNKYRLKMSINKGTICIVFYDGEKMAPAKIFVDKLIKKEIKEKIVILDEYTAKVDVENLVEVRYYLKSIDKTINISIDEDVANLEVSNIFCPGAFSYAYDYEKCELKMKLKNNFESWNEKWVIKRNRLYTLKMDNRVGFLKDSYRGNDIIDFLDMVSLNKIYPIEIKIKRSNERVFKLQIEKINDNTISINPIWAIPNMKTCDMKNLSGVENQIICNDIIYNGMSKKDLFSIFETEKFPIEIKGEGINLFIRNKFNSLRKWIEDEEILNTYMSKGEYIEVKQYAYIEKNSAVGTAFAIPYIFIGNNKIVAYKVSKEIKNEYVNMLNLKIEVSKLKMIGIGPIGRALDGSKLDIPIKLTAKEILNMGSERLDGICTSMTTDTIIWENPINSYEWIEKARYHLSLLTRIGIPGGIVMKEKESLDFLLEIIEKIVEEYPKTKILVVGKKEDMLFTSKVSTDILNYNKNINKDKSEPYSQVYLMDYQIELDEEILDTKWDIIYFIKPDKILEISTADYKQLINLNSKLKLCILKNDFVEMDNNRKYDITDMVGFKENLDVANYYFRNLDRKIELPVGYRFQEKFMLNNKVFTSEIIMEKRNNDKKLNNISNINEYDFKLNALKYMNIVENKGRYEDYNTHYPNYEGMSCGQREWYFYWRGQIKKGKFIETDIGYLILRVYEIINMIGIDSAMDGYLQLTNLWHEYKFHFSELGSLLVDWTFDFININSVPINMKNYLEFIMNNSDDVPDLLIDMVFVELSKKDNINLEIEMLELLSDHKIRGSGFYNNRTRYIIDNFIKNIIALIDEWIRDTCGEGIFGIFNPCKVEIDEIEAYKNVLYRPELHRYTIKHVPYSKHVPIREFISNIFRYCENLLREEFNYTGKLAIRDLEDEFVEIIDEYFEKIFEHKKKEIALEKLKIMEKQSESNNCQMRNSKKNIKPIEIIKTEKTIIDVDEKKVLEAEEESYAMLEKLTNSAETGENTEKNINEKNIIKENNNKEFIEVDSMLKTLDDYKISIVEAIYDKCSMEELKKILSKNSSILEVCIDEINAISNELIGDLLIETSSSNIYINEEYFQNISLYFSKKRASKSIL